MFSICSFRDSKGLWVLVFDFLGLRRVKFHEGSGCFLFCYISVFGFQGHGFVFMS